MFLLTFSVYKVQVNVLFYLKHPIITRIYIRKNKKDMKKGMKSEFCFINKRSNGLKS